MSEQEKTIETRIWEIIGSGKDMDVQAEELLCLYEEQRASVRSEIERAGEVGIDPHNYTNPTAIRVGIAMQQTHILALFEKEVQ